MSAAPLRALPPPSESPGDYFDGFDGDGPGDGVTGDRTDLRNAERLVEWHGDNLRFCATWGKWLAWDGARWAIDDARRAHRAAKQTVRRMLKEALEQQTIANRSLAHATEAGDEDAKNAATRAAGLAGANIKHAIQSQSATRLTAMLAVAQSDPRVIVQHTELDADPMVLNVRNGTLELRTGQLRPHRREDMITKLAPVDFDPKAKAPVWEKFLGRAMGGVAELIAFLQRAIGYALTGEVREHALIFNFGAGANGKSTFYGTAHALLGDYATPAPRHLLFRSRGVQHPTEYASLHGKRFVTCSEIEEGQAFDEALVKDLTGGDAIECRRMREDFWSYQPTHKLFLAGNHKPTVRGDDEGIWRRMQLVPWAVVIPEAERDPVLPAKLRAELPGILRWALEGCLAWQKQGLSPPGSVRGATKDYREENDRLGEFFHLHVIFEEMERVTRKQLRERYEGFCDENGDEPVGAKRFAARLRERGVQTGSVRTQDGPRDGWHGVRLATDVERATAASWGPRSDVVTSSGRSQVDPPRGDKGSAINTDPATTRHYSRENRGSEVTTDAQSEDRFEREAIQEEAREGSENRSKSTTRRRS